MDDPVPAAAPGMFLQDGAVSEACKCAILEEHPRHGGGHGIWYW